MEFEKNAGKIFSKHLIINNQKKKGYASLMTFFLLLPLAKGYADQEIKKLLIQLVG